MSSAQDTLILEKSTRNMQGRMRKSSDIYKDSVQLGAMRTKSWGDGSNDDVEWEYCASSALKKQ